MQRIAVITGASSGIGAATARLLAAQGFGVVINGRRTERLDALAKELTDTGSEVVGVSGDITRDGLVWELFDAATRHWSRPPDAFVLCAGRGLPGTVLTSDSTLWRELFEVNCLAVLNQLRASASLFVRQAKENPDTSIRDIVVIGSTIGRQISSFNPIYGSTKFAVHSVVEALRREICSQNIRTTLIEPGFVKSEFQESAGYDLAWFRSIEKNLGPLLEPEDVARTIEFVLRQPPHVHVDDIRIRPTRQEA